MTGVLVTLPDGTVIESRLLARTGPLYTATRGGVLLGSFASIGDVAVFINRALDEARVREEDEVLSSRLPQRRFGDATFG